MLVRARARLARAASLPARRADQARGARDRRARPGSPVASKAESQDLCFLAGRGQARVPRAPRRPRRARGRDRRPPTARVLGSHRGHHHFTVGQRRGIGVAGEEPLYVLATDADSNRVVVGPRERARDRPRPRPRRGPAPRRRGGSTAVRLRYHSRPLALLERAAAIGRRRPRSHAELTLRARRARRSASRPGQTAVADGRRRDRRARDDRRRAA